MIFRNLRAFIVCALLLIGLGAGAYGDTPVAGDLIIGFRTSGSVGVSTDFLVDLGTVSLYRDATSVLSLGTFGTDLSSIYGSQWFANTGVLWSAVAGINGAALNNDPLNTIYASSATTGVGIAGANYKPTVSNGQGTPSAKITTMVNSITQNSVGGVATNSYHQAAADRDSYGTYVTTHPSFGSPALDSGHFESSFSGTNASSSVLDLYQLQPLPNRFSTNLGVNIGYFTIDNSGTINFTPYALTTNGGGGGSYTGPWLWTAASGNWSGTNNWQSNAPATNGVAVGITGAAGGMITNDAVSTIASLSYSNSAGAYTITGANIAVTGGITNNSSATQTLATGITTTADQTINAAAGNLAFTGGIANSANLTMQEGAQQQIVVNSPITGSGVLIQSGSGTLVLSTSNSYSGGTVLNGGTVVAANNNSFGSGVIAVASNATVSAGVANLTTINSVALASGATATLDTTGNNWNHSGVISGSGAVSKNGVGTLTLGGVNTYSGATAVNKGTLQVNGALNSAGSVSVESGATLAGTGSVGAVTLKQGSTIMAGGSIGNLTVQSAIWNGGNYNWKMADASGAAGIAYDTLTITGGLNLSGLSSSNQFGINLWTLSGTSPLQSGAALNFNPNVSTNWTLASVGGGITGFSSNSFLISTGAVNGTGGFANSVNGNFGITTNATGLVLTYTTVYVAALPIWTNGSGQLSQNAGITNGVGVVFTGAGGSVTNNSVSSLASLIYSNNAGAYNLGGFALSLGAGGVVNNSTNTQTLSLSLTTATNQTFSAASGNLLVTGGIVTLGNLTLQEGAGKLISVTSAVKGAGALTQTGSGTLLLATSNSYSGGTTLNGGTVVAGNNNSFGSGAIGVAANATVAAGTNLTLGNTLGVNNGVTASLNNQGNGWVQNGAISGAGAIALSGVGTTTLASSNSYSGGTTINGGTVVAANNNSFGSGTIAVASNATVSAGVANLTTTNSVGIASGATVTLDTAGNNWNHSGVINGSGAVSKNGVGTLTLGGANTYSGATAVNKGTLQVSGALNSAGSVSVESGATLAGTGSVGGVILKQGSTIMAGGSIGSLTLQSAIWNGGNYNWKMADASGVAGIDYDTLTINGGLNLSGLSSSNQFDINLWTLSGKSPLQSGAALNFNPNASTNWTLASVGGGITGFSSNSFLISTGALNGTGGFANSLNGNFGITTNATGLILTYTTAYVPVVSSVWTNGSGQLSQNVGITNGAGVIFAGIGGSVTNNSVTNLDSLSYSNNAGSYNLGGLALTLGAGGIGNGSSNTQTISTALSLGTVQSFTAGTGNLIIAGAINTAGNTLTVTGSKNTLISGSISGAGGLTKTGTGVLTLTATNSYTGTTVISAGTLQLSGGNNRMAVGDAVVVAGGALFDLGTNIQRLAGLSGNGTVTGSTGGRLVLVITNNQNIASSLTEGLRLGIAGNGTTTLASSNNYSGGTTINGGTVVAANNNSFGTGAIGVAGNAAIAAGTNLTLNNTLGVSNGVTASLNNQGNSWVQNGAISGAGAIALNGAGTTTLSTSNSYSGGTTINGGTVVAANNNSFGSGAIGVASNAIIAAGTNLTLGNALGVSNGVTASLNNQGNSWVQDGAIGGAGTLGLSGTGTTTLASSNSYSGGTTINGGTVVAANNNSFGSGAIGVASNAIIAAGTNLTLGNALGVSNGVTASLNNQGNSWVQNGAISGAGTIALSGAGTTTLASSNSYSGGTTLNGGSLILGNDSGLGTGVLSVAASGSLTAGTNLTVGNSVVIGGGAVLGLNNGGNAWMLNGAISGQGSVVIAGTIKTTFGASNSYTGGTTLNSGAVLWVVDDHALGSGAINIASIARIATQTNVTIANAMGVAKGGVVTIHNKASQWIQNGKISGQGGVNFIGTGTTTVNSSNSYTGGTTVNSGYVMLGNASALGSATNSLSVVGAVVNLGSQSITQKSVTVTSGTLTNGTLTADSVSLNGGIVASSIAGAGSVTQVSGTAILSGSNSYRGGTIISAGNLMLGNAFALGSETNGLSVGNALLNLGAQSITQGSVSVTGGTITNGTLFVGSLSLNGGTVAASIAGAGSVTQVSGTTILSGSNSYSGGTIVSGGSLILANAYALGATNGSLSVTNGALDLGGFSDFVGSFSLNSGAIGNGTLTSASAIQLTGNVAITATLLGPGGLNQSGSGTINLGNTLPTGTISMNGGTLITSNAIAGASSNSSGTISLSGHSRWNNSGLLTIGGSGNGSLTISSGSTLSAGGLQIARDAGSQGTVTLGDSNGAGNLSLGSGTVSFGAGNGTLVFAQSGQEVISNPISGKGTLTSSGTGTTTLSGNDSGFTGSTYLSSGAVVLGANSQLGGTVNVANKAATFALNTNSSLTGTGVIAVAGKFIDHSGLAFTNAIKGSIVLSSTGELQKTYTNGSSVDGFGAGIGAGKSFSILAGTVTAAGTNIPTLDATLVNGALNFKGTFTNAAVLSMIDPSFSAIRNTIQWYNTNTSQWENTINGNTGNVIKPGNQGFSGSFNTFLLNNLQLSLASLNQLSFTLINQNLISIMGAYGYDSSSHTAWAVINHNSIFSGSDGLPDLSGALLEDDPKTADLSIFDHSGVGIQSVPEPSTWALLFAALVIVAARFFFNLRSARKKS